jgi:hypothetical protein
MWYKRRESPSESFFNKTNIIPEVHNKSIIMFFKKGLRNSSLIGELTMKNPRTTEKMLAIANKYTLDTRYQKKDRELSYSDQPSTLKNNHKKRKSDHFVANVEQPRYNM